MNLSNCEVIPSVIVDTNDPMKLGRIKCVVPGYLDNATMSTENMPWIRPFGMTRHQSFSKMVKGFKVWVIINKSNYDEYWYLPFYEYNDITRQYLEDTYDGDQPEILISHNNGGNHAMLTYDEKNGYNQKIGQHHLEMHPDGHISMVGGSHEVDIDGEIKIGLQGGDYKHATKAEPLVQILSDLSTHFSSLCEAANSSVFTAHLADLFMNCKEACDQAHTIQCDHTNVN